jgi:hypothetical protein
MTVQKIKILLSALFLFSTLNAFTLTQAKASESTDAEFSNDARINKCDFRSDMRKLWEDHITWTRLFIINAVAGHSETNATTQRLLKNQTDIGNAIKPFYGAAAGHQLTLLLRSHILIAADIVNAAKVGNSRAVQLNSRKWLDNADAISIFLNKANPKYWPLTGLKSMMHSHLTLTTNELKAHLGKNWSSDIAAYEAVHKEILMMSDALALGIINQFPERFSN